MLAAGLFSVLLPTNGFTVALSLILIAGGIAVLALGKRSPKKERDHQRVEPAVEQASPLAEEKTAAPKPSVYRRHHTVVGVSFKNSDGTSRQKALRTIAKLQEEGADGIEDWPTISIRQYEYEGQPAIGVYADDVQIGNIAKDEVPAILRNKDTVRAYDLSIYGGEDGKYYGAELIIIYNAPAEE